MSDEFKKKSVDILITGVVSALIAILQAYMATRFSHTVPAASPDVAAGSAVAIRYFKLNYWS